MAYVLRILRDVGERSTKDANGIHPHWLVTMPVYHKRTYVRLFAEIYVLGEARGTNAQTACRLPITRQAEPYRTAKGWRV